MYFRQTTVYAIRIIAYLAKVDTLASAQEIVEAMDIPAKYFMKVARILRDEDLIQAKRGREGGFILNKSPEDISLEEIIDIFEKNPELNVVVDNKSIFNSEFNALEETMKKAYHTTKISSLV